MNVNLTVCHPVILTSIPLPLFYLEKEIAKTMELLKEILHHIKGDLKLPPYKEDGSKVEILSQKQNGERAVSPMFENGAPTMPFPASNVVEAQARAGRTLCAPCDGYKPVYELTLEITGSDINRFDPGDTIGVIPRNDSKDVDSLLERLGILDQADNVYLLEKAQSKSKSQISKHIPTRSTLRYTFTHCLELRAVVKKLFLLALSKFTSNEDEKRCLEVLCSTEGSAVYADHILSKNVCLADVLQSFPSCSPPVTCIMAHLPRLLPRPYSVVNSWLKYNNCIKICFSVINSVTIRKGLTTAWLEKVVTKLEHESTSVTEDGKFPFENGLRLLSLSEKSKDVIPIYLRTNMGFSFPKEHETLVLMIGPGTGVAPFIGFLEERMFMKKKDSDVELGETWLIYGCRNPDVDYIYKEELSLYLDEGILSRLTTSFSRIENGGIKYVQHAIEANGKDVAEFIANGALVYVCGDLPGMARAVQHAITRCLELHTERSAVEAANLVTQLQRDKKYLVDVWS